MAKRRTAAVQSNATNASIITRIEDTENIAPVLIEDDYRNMFLKAKRLFHRSAQVRIVGRSLERASIQKFWDAIHQNTMESESTGNTNTKQAIRAMYVCGNPGTGKTALIEEMLAEYQQQQQQQQSGSFIPIRINCMLCDTPESVFTEIRSRLAANCSISNSKSTAALDDIGPLLQECKQLHPNREIVLILDEVDSLISGTDAVSSKNYRRSTSSSLNNENDHLQRIFSLCQQHNNLVIIGIANSLDLSVRHLNRISTHVVAFQPYAAEDMVHILTARMHLIQNSSYSSSEKSQPLIHPMAIEMCARKAALVGDFRKALEIMRDAICALEREIIALNYTTSTPCQVQLKHVIQAVERILSNANLTCSASRNSQRIADLNLHQKLALAALRRLLLDDQSMRPSTSILHQRYLSFVQQVQLVEPVGRSEFLDLLGNMESVGLITLVKPLTRQNARGRPPKKLMHSKSAGMSALTEERVHLSIPIDDLTAGLSSNPLLL